MHFCTISTYDHAYKVFALCESLIKTNPAFTLHVLFVDKQTEGLPFDQLEQYSLSELNAVGIGKDIIEKYKDQTDKLRWSLKPVFLKKIIQRFNLPSAIYIDNDICFFEDFSFLFDLLLSHAFLLTPHNYERSPFQNQNMMEANFRVGLYNAGFVGASKDSIETLDWWASCCLYRCEKNALRGTFDDQKYLDLVPIMEPTAHIVRNQGCNVAEWNRTICIRSLNKGKVYINHQFPIIFIHFNYTTVRVIVRGEDPLLQSYLDLYVALLKKHSHNFKLTSLYRNPTLIERVKYKIWKVATRLGF